MSDTQNGPQLSIVIATVGGPIELSRILNALREQAGRFKAEVLVPYHEQKNEYYQIADEYPEARFIGVPIDALTDLSGSAVRKHFIYDRLRSAGLSHSNGEIVVMTEDHAVPAPDWCEQILNCHREMSDCPVIGGAIENNVDRPLNWAWYYCDFARYGRPFSKGFREYVSDVNISYKRDALFAFQHLWNESYQETTLHWEMLRTGKTLFLDDRIVVWQNRLSMKFSSALSERVEWGCVFAMTRASQISWLSRLLYAFGTFVLPLLLIVRSLAHMARQKRSAVLIARVTPLTLLLQCAWSFGEFLGYLKGGENCTSTASRNDQTRNSRSNCDHIAA